jgi:RNA polymerase sigma factor (sigma-70 family)
MEAQSVPRSGALAYPRSPRLLAPLGDERLVEQVRRGNDAAFEVIFDRHHRGILAFCRHMLASAEEAEDAVQHTFAQAYDSMRRGDRELKLKPWLYAIARNRCISILRARREEASELADIPTAGLTEAVQQRHELRELLADIRELPVDQRAALVLSEVGDLSHGDIANVVGCPVSKVKSLVFQARSSLLETRNARDIPCQQIREQLATASGGALRRGPLRRHVSQCDGCREYRDSVKRQKAMLAAALPVVPTLALKKGALAAAGIGGAGGAGGAAAGGGAAGGIASIVGGGGAMKAIAVIAVTGAAVGGGIAVTEHASQGAPESAGSRHFVPAAPESVKSNAAASGAAHRGAHGRGGKAHAHARGHHGGASGVTKAPHGAGSKAGGGAKGGGSGGGSNGGGKGNAHHGNPNAGPPPVTTTHGGPPTSVPGVGNGGTPGGGGVNSNSGGNGGGSSGGNGGGSAGTGTNSGNHYGQQYDEPGAPPGHQDDHFRNDPPPRHSADQSSSGDSE